MDFTKFSDENFDLKDWINAAFVSQKETNQNQEVDFNILKNLKLNIQLIRFEINKAIRGNTRHQTSSFHSGKKNRH